MSELRPHLDVDRVRNGSVGSYERFSVRKRRTSPCLRLFVAGLGPASRLVGGEGGFAVFTGKKSDGRS